MMEEERMTILQEPLIEDKPLSYELSAGFSKSAQNGISSH